MAGLTFLQRARPETPVAITVSRLAAVRDIRTEARHAPAIIEDYRRRRDVYAVRATCDGRSGTVPGPLRLSYGLAYLKSGRLPNSPAFDQYDRVSIHGDGLSGIGTIVDTVDPEEFGPDTPLSYYVELDPDWDDPECDGSAPTYPVRAEHLRTIGGAS